MNTDKVTRKDVLVVVLGTIAVLVTMIVWNIVP
jgi:hypothetical protein